MEVAPPTPLGGTVVGLGVGEGHTTEEAG